MRIRSFIAIVVDDAIKDELRKIQDKLRQAHLEQASVKWVDTSQIHLTVKFLGEIEEHLIDEVSAMVVKSTADIPPFDVRISGLSAFPNSNRPRVIVVGVQDEASFLEKMFRDLEQKLVSIGVEAEKRELKPHLTLGRVRRGKKRKVSRDIGSEAEAWQSLRGALQELADVDLGVMNVSEVVLFRSELTRTGPIYTALSRAALARE